MARPINHRELVIPESALRSITDTRLRDFVVLWQGGQHHTAIYVAGYAVEACLKLGICRTLKVPNLPTIFEYHELESLLFFSGYDHELRDDKKLIESFNDINDLWNVEMRYSDPSTSSIDHNTCVNVNKWLNDSAVGLVPWFRRKL